MSYARTLVAFMEGVKTKIEEIAGVKFGKLYFNEEDKQELLSLPEEQAFCIYLKIKIQIIKFQAMDILYYTCPFCYIAKDNCKNCKYAKRHGGECNEKNSDRDKYIDRLYDLIYPDRWFNEVFSNKFYKKLIKTIEKEGI